MIGLKQIGYVVLAVIILVTVAWVSNSFPRKSVLNDILKSREAEIRAEYQQKIIESENTILQLRKEINDSNNRIISLDLEIKNLKKKKSEIKKPQTPQEIIDAFTALGYPPIK